MDAIVQFLVIVGLGIAFVSRCIEHSREEQRRLRMIRRTNTKPWSRSNSKHK